MEADQLMVARDDIQEKIGNFNLSKIEKQEFRTCS